MTTWESIDKTDMENVTVTSDVAYERVTSDEHFVDEWERTFLKQNTAWLVQEIPNIAFLDIADTMLENKKTLVGRNNWLLKIGKEGKSVEVQPQDIVSVWTSDEKTYTESGWIVDSYIEFDSYTSWDNNTACIANDEAIPGVYTCDILQNGVYTISYWCIVEVNSATQILIRIWKVWAHSWIISEEFYKGSSLPEVISCWRTTSNITIDKWDSVYMKIIADDDVKVYSDAYMDIKFQQYNI